jgi:hypothetical protein
VQLEIERPRSATAGADANSKLDADTVIARAQVAHRALDMARI